jgi:hypothetical protein
MALAALSRKNALIVEPIRRTWRKSSSYSSGRNLTMTLTVRPALSSVSDIQYPTHIGASTMAGHTGKYQVDPGEIGKRRRGVAATGPSSACSSASSRPDHEDIETVHRTPRNDQRFEVDATAPVGPRFGGVFLSPDQMDGRERLVVSQFDWGRSISGSLRRRRGFTASKRNATDLVSCSMVYGFGRNRNGSTNIAFMPSLTPAPVV